MDDWSAGYVTDIGYTYGYYPELNPLRVQLALLSAGIAAPAAVGAACELGFGQGVSINMHAAASPTHWWGTDFNPAQVGFAQELARTSGARAELFDDAFADFAHRPGLPEFDYIGLHGIWSWISDENRKAIVDFIARRLKVGGVVYVSYNTLPGWAGFMPMRHMLAQHAELMGSRASGTVRRVDAALDFADRLLATNPAYGRVHPAAGERLKKMREQARPYLAHEYFNRDWHPMHFADAAEMLGKAKLGYACSAHLTDLVDAVNLTQDQRNLLGEIADPLFRETVRDFMVNQQFRRDYWVKGARRLSAAEQADALRKLRVVLVTSRTDVPLKFTGAMGEATMAEGVYGPILDALGGNKPMSLAELEAAVDGKKIGFSQLRQAVLVLAGGGHVHAAQDDPAIAKAAKQTDKLNAHLMQRARWSGDLNFLASPVTGGGITVGRITQLFLLQSLQNKKAQPSDMARAAWDLLASQGQRVLKEGKPLEDPQQNLAELTAQANAFVQKQQSVLKALQVV
ncbi:class I SAM-dependent methyltransferase [Ramlibacter sp.]|uniref:class I SAM-dependent methyltransferase n=1 Tax=Ramlibacter sp. TaxID=1917967 RepID=UPI0017A0E6B5|nr:class I SAM-dependent methyltransferase [Ramlibacter sp.]MBA2673514.1 methyltransferase regulatory domain-containing protein [Ramlibacter sp.]